MASIPINSLPEKIIPVADTVLLVVQDGADTKKMTMGTLTNKTNVNLNAHLEDTVDAHDASAISAAPSGGPLTGGDVQAQLGQVGSFIAGLDASDVPATPGAVVLTGTNVQAQLTQAETALAHSSQAIPAAGTTGQVLAKKTVTDYDTQWIDVAAISGAVPTARTISTTAPLQGGGQLTTDLALTVDTFGTSQPGVVGPSGGGSTNFLRADGVWTAPPSAAPAAPVRRVVNDYSGFSAFTPQAADENKMSTFSNATAVTITLPSNATQSIQIGAEFDFLWLGTQPSVTFVAGSGATVVGTPGLKLRARYSACTAKKISVDGWLLIGDTAP